MARCPNCGRETRRTIDWCCQWCGYPLFSGSYKKIDKTYKELKDERTGISSDDEGEVKDQVIDESAEEEYEEEIEEEEPEIEEKPVQQPRLVKKVRPAPEPEPAPRKRRRIVKRRKPEPEPEPEPEMEEYEEDEYEDEYEDEIEEEYEDDEDDEDYDEEIDEEEENNIVINQPAMELTVDQLVSAYETEGPDADAKFANKILRVTGVISRIDVKEAQALFSLTLEAEKSSPLRQSVRCIFSREHGSELQRLIKSQKVTVQGKYDGSIINISMRDCHLVH